ncbi:hypothetical protein QJS66_08565 [Kocuria rhizophila]|nr:hypothetical protein QJS66_08565 [Kocuria rhizophila]
MVGFDLAGPEDGFPASAHSDALELLAAEHVPAYAARGEAAGAGASMADALRSGRAPPAGAPACGCWTRTGDDHPLTLWIRDRRDRV